MVPINFQELAISPPTEKSPVTIVHLGKFHDLNAIIFITKNVYKKIYIYRYVGRRCESCDSGYVGNPTIPGDYCRPAPVPSRCDPRGTQSEENGVCHCKIHAAGPRCSECSPQAFFLSNENM